MGKKLYVGNLPYSATEQALTDAFAQCGTVESAKIITDRDTGRSKGFGFVEMSSDAEAANAITKFNGADYDGRAMTVNEAKPMAPRENRDRNNFSRGGRY
ncbi:MAG: RNA-binding protein [Bdellovibrionales bacterium]|nr:RNA-binding protein [Bdellovibrionales bacterium]NDD91815.1 RNA-binding protein [bacterium]